MELLTFFKFYTSYAKDSCSSICYLSLCCCCLFVFMLLFFGFVLFNFFFFFLLFFFFFQIMKTRFENKTVYFRTIIFYMHSFVGFLAI